MIVVIVRWVLVVWITGVRVVLVAVAVAVGGLLLWAVHRSRVVPVVRRRLLDDDHCWRFLKPERDSLLIGCEVNGKPRCWVRISAAKKSQLAALLERS